MTFSREEMIKIGKETSKTLVYLTNGKVFVEIDRDGMRFVCPDELKEGINELMKFGEMDKKKQRPDFQKMNKFFDLCGIDLKWAEKEKTLYSLTGTDQKKFAQFLKTICGCEIPDKDLF